MSPDLKSPVASRRLQSLLVRFGQFAFVFLPAWLLIALIAQNAVNIPVWDDWDRAALFEKWDQGTLTFADIYAPHIDHRIVFPRLLSLAIAQFAEGDLRWEMAANWLIGFFAGLGIWRLALHTLGPARWTLGIAFLANLWIFSPIQYDNWLWSIQTAFLLPMTCLVWALFFCLRPWRWWIRALLASVLAIIGMHSFSHGLFIWPTVIGMALLLPRSILDRKGFFVLVVSGIGAAVLSCYFLIDYRVATEYSYNRPLDSSPPAVAFFREALEHPDRLRDFFLSFLGQPVVRQFSIDPYPFARAAGIGALLVFLAGTIWYFRKRKDYGSEAPLLPWISLGICVIIIAAATSAGRIVVLDDARAVVARLYSVSIYLYLAILAMGTLFFRSNGSSQEPSARRLRAGALILGGLITLQCQPWIYGKKMMEIWRFSRQHAQARVMFMNHFPLDPRNVVSYQVNGVTQGAPVYDRLGFLEHPFVDDLSLNQFSLGKRPLSPNMGKLALKSSDEVSRTLQGHAIFRRPTRPADAVLITARGPKDKSPQIIGLASFDGSLLPTRYRIDLQFSALTELRETDPGTWYRWKYDLDIEALPADRPLKIQAWAFDVNKRKAYPIREAVLLNKDGGTRIESD